MPCGTAAALAPLLQGAGTRAAGPSAKPPKRTSGPLARPKGGRPAARPAPFLLPAVPHGGGTARQGAAGGLYRQPDLGGEGSALPRKSPADGRVQNILHHAGAQARGVGIDGKKQGVFGQHPGA